jgi:hypothetical protein
MAVDDSYVTSATAWTLLHEHNIYYFHCAWHNHGVLYSTKSGNEQFRQRYAPIFLKQVHSDIIVDIDRAHAAHGDGLTSTRKNLALGIRVADCLPVYLFSDERACLIHCGWRGIIRGIVKKAAQLMPFYKYVLGASIGACCYEVKDDVAALFRKHYARALISRKEKFFIDLKAAVIEDLGQEHLIASLDLCTHCHPEYFYSNRRGDTERNYAVLLT